MRDVRVIEAHDLGDDRLLVRGTVDGAATEAFGWVSATTNHYDHGTYGADGHRDQKAAARAMTVAERRAYCARLLEAAVGPAPRPVEI